MFVALGGAFGSVLRYLLAAWTQTVSKSIDFPYGTLVVNLIGCFVIGFLSQLAEARVRAQEALKAMMKAAGFGHVDVHNLTAGVVALHVGVKC